MDGQAQMENAVLEPLHPALFVLLDSSPDDPPTPSLSNGKRAHSPSPGPSTLPNGKRPHLDSPSCLPIASLTFSLVLDPDSTTTKVAELLNLLSTSTSSYPVEIVYGRKAREASLTLVSPTTSTPTSQTPLLSLDPVNRTLWNPPSTAPVGAGSLLEAIAALASLSLLSLSPSLSASYPDLSLRIQITLEPAFFTHATTPSHALFLNYLFPSPLPEGWEGETTISDFYRCLRRAPRTVGGIAVGVDRKGKGREDRKGKGRAVEEDTREDELLEPEGLEATLMPFQSRSVRWMLAREGKRVRPMLEEEEEDVEMGEGGEDDLEGVREREKEPVVLERLEEEEMRDLWRGPLWEKVEREDLQGVERGFWLNRVAGRLSLVDPLEERLEEDGEEGGRDLETGGGLLSEEMGLGKSLMVISLILLHRQPERNDRPSYYNETVDSQVQPTGLTLIIAPSAIVEQWQGEIRKHAPGLRVLRYEAIRLIKEKTTASEIADKYDVVLTTFDVLRKEVVLARKPHERALRSGKEGRHRYRRSLLVQIDFLRVIMDEAQMVGDTVSLTSETVSLIPRKFSFAVTGTPLNTRIEDLQGLLRFLKVEPVGSSRAHLFKLLAEVPTFVRVCEQLGARTLKAHVEHELVIPDQRRFVVPVEFGAVEKYWYDSRYIEALEQLGLDQDGSPKHDSVDAEGNPTPWIPDKADMNRWLVALRQLCCHPQIGQANKKGLGKVLKTVEDVLATMMEAAISSWMSDFRSLWLTRVRRAQLLMFDLESCERFEEALEVFERAVEEMQPVIEEVAGSIREAWRDRRAERLKRTRSASVASSDKGEGISGALALGLDDEDEASGDAIPLSDFERALATRTSALRSRLRELLIVQHSAQFLVGSAYFNLGKFSELETTAYADAELLRQTLLTPWEDRVEMSIVRLRTQMDDRDEDEALEIDALEFQFNKTGHGLVAQAVFDDVETTTDVLNGYAELLWRWRESVLAMMYTRVSVAGEDATGEEYADRAELQEKLDIYLEAFAVLLSDWRACLTGERSALADAQGIDAHAFANKKNVWVAADGSRRKREKKGKGLLKDKIAPTLERGDTPGDILRYELLVERTEAKGEDMEQVDVIPIRNLIKSLKDAGENTSRQEEVQLIEMESRRLRKTLAAKEKICDRLRSELQDITKAFNTRLEYFAQLQLISDAVLDPDMGGKKWKGLAVEMQTRLDEEAKLEINLTKKASQRRYLESLCAEGTEDIEDTHCSICSDVFTAGVLTACGHLSCEACFNAWRARSRNCAICKRELKHGDWERVKYHRAKAAPGLAKERSEDVEMDDAVEYEAPIKLSTISATELEDIEAIDTVQPLSAKSDVVVKHVKYLRRQNPANKIVVFSAWTESLAILMQAFQRNGIQYVRLEGGGKKEQTVTRFIQDPAVAAFFLHTKSQAAGLNLTCAQYVFLVEPLLHPSLELQAVGRVHRIGQAKETSVYQYYVADTVDQRVAELRGRQTTSLFLRSTHVDTAKESKALENDIAASGSKQNGKSLEETIEDEDEIARCLFDPKHLLALQKSLLPLHLRGPSKTQKKQPTAGEMAAAAAMGRQNGAGLAGPVAGGRGGS